MSDDQQEPDTSKRQGRGFLALIQSTLAAIFGIQSDRNREADFKKGDASQFITMGVIGLLVIITVMIVVVNTVLESAGK